MLESKREKKKKLFRKRNKEERRTVLIANSWTAGATYFNRKPDNLT